VINAAGAVLTALHVVDGATRIQLGFADGTTSGATVLVTKPESDIAVLAPDRLPDLVVPAVMAGPPPVGDAVYAVGNPLGLTHSLTAGVVSATDRSIPTGRGQLSGLIQFDAAVNPGNSGGPLLNRAGQVVGIVTALANPANQDFFVGIGFAVPIATAGGAAGGPQQ
jgi:S1-C subfamily serine protease